MKKKVQHTLSRCGTKQTILYDTTTARSARCICHMLSPGMCYPQDTCIVTKFGPMQGLKRPTAKKNNYNQLARTAAIPQPWDPRSRPLIREICSTKNAFGTFQGSVTHTCLETYPRRFTRWVIFLRTPDTSRTGLELDICLILTPSSLLMRKDDRIQIELQRDNTPVQNQHFRSRIIRLLLKMVFWMQIKM